MYAGTSASKCYSLKVIMPHTYPSKHTTKMGKQNDHDHSFMSGEQREFFL